MRHDQLVRERREEILRIASRHGARRAGPRLRGLRETDRESDMDFLVELARVRY